MMASLKKQLVSKYESGGEVKGVWSPQNTESVSLTFHESKVAKVRGKRPTLFLSCLWSSHTSLADTGN